MRAAVVGAGWGQVHVRALRAHGVDVVALCGHSGDQARTSEASRDLGVANALHDPRALLDLDLDLVTVASPADTHPSLLQLLNGMPVICEKPVLGMRGDPQDLPRRDTPVWINYAFAFLDSARRLQGLVSECGPVRCVRISTSYNLPLSFTPESWFLELASHPLSFVVHLLGRPQLHRGRQGLPPYSQTVLELRFGEVPGVAECAREPGLRGIEHRLTLTTDDAVLELTGRYEEGRRWRYGPVLIDGNPRSVVEDTPEDCWYLANERSIGTCLRVLTGRLTQDEAHRAGLFTLTRALPIDECVRQAFPQGG